MMSNTNPLNSRDDIISELKRYRQEFAEVYDTFITERLCDEYHDYMKNTNVTIYTSIYTSTELKPKYLSSFFDNKKLKIGKKNVKNLKNI